MIEDMKIGEVMRIVDALRPTDGEHATASACHGMAIVVLDRGFVYVGRVDTDANWCTIRDARNIRYWGTTKGLGQLATEGPTVNTKLDVTGTIKAPMRAVISIVATKEELWKIS